MTDEGKVRHSKPPEMVWLPVNVAGIPWELKARPQWVRWMGKLKDAKTHCDKVPYQVEPRLLKASISDPTTWADFSQLEAMMREPLFPYDGVSFALTSSDPYVCVDLDHCREPQSGEIDASARLIVSRLDSFTELSPSGTGLHIWVKGRLPGSRHKRDSVEMYEEKRLMTVTGQHLPGTPSTIETREDALHALYRQYLEPPPSAGGAQPRRTLRTAGPPWAAGDEELVRQASSAGNGDKFTRLWRGDTSDYASASEADMALCSLLGYWTDYEPDRMDRLFRQSGLYRPKWDEMHGSQTYGELTIGKVVSQAGAGASKEPAPLNGSPGQQDLRTHVWQHDELLNHPFPEPQWLIQDLLPDEGLVLLGGVKKVGKSFFALSCARAVSGGTSMLGREARKGRILYLALEDGPRRMQQRLHLLRAVQPLDAYYAYKLTPLNEGGMEELEALIAEYKPALVVIDTLAAAKTSKIDENSAGAMADLANGLRGIAQKHHLTILCVAHHGKKTWNDPGHDLRGSSAIPAASDLNLALYPKEGKHALQIEGRDVEETELIVQLDKTTWEWRDLVEATNLGRFEAEANVFEALDALGEAEAERVADYIGRERSTVQRTLKRLADEQRITSRRVQRRKVYSTLSSGEGESQEPTAQHAHIHSSPLTDAAPVHAVQCVHDIFDQDQIEIDFADCPPATSR